MTDWLHDATRRAERYLNTIDERAVFPSDEALEALDAFDEPFPEQSSDVQSVIAMLDELGASATVATTGSRYFGFVTGGILPAGTASNILMSAWDQNAAAHIMSPITAKLEEVSLAWLIDVLGLEGQATSGGFVTGATTANFTALAAARHYLLSRKGWDVEANGLFGAPEIKVVVGDEVHVSVLQALQMLGFGKERVIRVPVDDQGAILAEQLPPLDDMTLVCIQAGNVNSGAFDPAEAICQRARDAGAWVHVDGAFGLWVSATETHKHLTMGYELADSWATDGHKWLNVSYDNGIVLCRHEEALRNAMIVNAPYLIMGETREPSHYTPELSRRARGIEIWAAMKSLGRSGLADLITRDCQLASYFADGLRDAGFEILNDVIINQVLVAFGNREQTLQTIEAIQRDGTLWAGSSVWKGQTAMRISVSSWKTTQADIDRCVEAISRIARTILTQV
ncbi:MAG: aminotransferase class V-fold PLP-dependent enzyme [Chloroflexota bacterium]